MYLVEGVGALQAAYDLNAGDVLVFSRGHDGRLIVYGRPNAALASKPCRGVKRRTQQDPVEAPAPRAVEMLEAGRRCKRARRPTAKAAAWAAEGGMQGWGASSGEEDPSTPIQAAWGRTCQPLSVEEQRQLLPTPVVDGVFRPLRPHVPTPPPCDSPLDYQRGASHILLRAAHQQGVWLYDAGVWLATLVVRGNKVFQAAFETRAAAENALAAVSCRV